jgi:hypothetical protein
LFHATLFVLRFKHFSVQKVVDGLANVGFHDANRGRCGALKMTPSTSCPNNLSTKQEFKVVRAKLQRFIRSSILSPTHPGIEPRCGNEEHNQRGQPHEGKDKDESEKVNSHIARVPSARNQPFPNDINRNEYHVSEWDHDKAGHEDDVEENRARSGVFDRRAHHS